MQCNGSISEGITPIMHRWFDSLFPKSAQHRFSFHISNLISHLMCAFLQILVDLGKLPPARRVHQPQQVTTSPLPLTRVLSTFAPLDTTLRLLAWLHAYNAPLAMRRTLEIPFVRGRVQREHTSRRGYALQSRQVNTVQGLVINLLLFLEISNVTWNILMGFYDHFDFEFCVFLLHFFSFMYCPEPLVWCLCCCVCMFVLITGYFSSTPSNSYSACSFSTLPGAASCFNSGTFLGYLQS